METFVIFGRCAPALQNPAITLWVVLLLLLEEEEEERNIVKTKPDCVCREMKTGPWGEACWVKELRNEMRLQKFLGLLCSYNAAAADEAESISSLLMDGSS